MCEESSVGQRYADLRGLGHVALVLRPLSGQGTILARRADCSCGLTVYGAQTEPYFIRSSDAGCGSLDSGTGCGLQSSDAGCGLQSSDAGCGLQSAVDCRALTQAVDCRALTQAVDCRALWTAEL